MKRLYAIFLTRKQRNPKGTAFAMTKTEEVAKNSHESSDERGFLLNNNGAKQAISNELWFNYFTDTLYSKGLIKAEQRAKLMSRIAAKSNSKSTN